ncbi:MAG: lysostaphin resistance A-like protein [Terracidiphilus sp.]
MRPRAAVSRHQSSFLKPFWIAFIGPPWVVSLAGFAVLAGIRFIATFSPYPLQELFFMQTVAMWAIPFLFLTESGRRQIGLSQRGITRKAMLLSVLAGVACALAFFALGMVLYGDSPNNWCISIRSYLHFEEMRGLMSPLSLFALYALPAISLNPVGEEILFRGFIQESFSLRFNPAIAALINSMLFGLIYLYLHGIWHDGSGFHLRAGSAALAIFLMACIGAIFTLCRVLSGSLWPAMAAHAAFNLTLLAAAIHQFAR